MRRIGRLVLQDRKTYLGLRNTFHWYSVQNTKRHTIFVIDFAIIRLKWQIQLIADYDLMLSRFRIYSQGTIIVFSLQSRDHS